MPAVSAQRKAVMKYKRTSQQVRVLAVLLCLAAFLVLNSIVHARKCLDAGMTAHLAKPLNMPLVKATIAKFTQHSTTV